MSKREVNKDIIPVHSEEAAIIGNLFDEAISIFEKYKINMSLTEIRIKY